MAVRWRRVEACFERSVRRKTNSASHATSVTRCAANTRHLSLILIDINIDIDIDIDIAIDADIDIDVDIDIVILVY